DARCVRNHVALTSRALTITQRASMVNGGRSIYQANRRGERKRGPTMPRKIRITTTSFDLSGGRSVDLNREQALRFLEAAGSAGSDLACLPETFLQTGLPSEQMPAAEPLTGPTFEALAASARKHHMWVVAGYFVRSADDRIENVAVVIDRDGQL